MEQAGNGPDWTAERVEARLIAAFRALPHSPVFGGGRLGFAPAAGGPASHAEALGWPVRFVEDGNARLILLTWARCRATSCSVRERYAGMGWKRTTAERLRRRALGRIVTCLKSGH